MVDRRPFSENCGSIEIDLRVVVGHVWKMLTLLKRGLSEVVAFGFDSNTACFAQSIGSAEHLTIGLVCKLEQ
jgi:hypothetical protein